MDSADRPHRSNNNSSSSSSSSELFICFTSRLSSSSMKISSKSILSPGRAREASQISLSTSLSRRLRSSGSMRGGQASPMFPTNTGKKRGCGFENPEPSSPKVTCIGQVRVKTKKQGRKMRARSKRRAGEVSFRRAENSNTNVNHQFLNQPPPPQQPQPAECLPHRNQRWVHLPMTICEALRALGGDLNCFLPCRSSCMAGEKDKEDRVGHGSGNGSACGVFARWLVAVQDGEGKGREIELVVGGEEEEEEEEEKRRSYRRHVFEEIEFKEEMEEEEARVSICIPPKNALLLMRCRSDPVRMAALSNKFWEPTVPDEPEGAEEGVEEENHGENAEQVKSCSLQEVGSARLEEKSDIEHIEEVISGRIEEGKAQETDTGLVNLEDRDGEDIREQSRDSDGEQEENSSKQEIEGMNLESGNDHESEFEMHQEKENGQEDKPKLEAEQEIGEGLSDESSVLVGEQQGGQESEFVAAGQDLEEEEEEGEGEGEGEGKTETETTGMKCEEEEATTSQKRSEWEEHQRGENGERGSRLRESTERQQALLPDCLLLMMCEPKLSMEVSKETWVCSTDFMRSLPQHPKAVSKAEEPKKRMSGVSDHAAQQPPRSSCSYPAKPPARAAGTESMSNVVEKKVVGGKGYEALVLKRCKSEPMRSAAKLAAEPCFWKNRKLEAHRPATVGVGAAGVGF